MADLTHVLEWLSAEAPPEQLTVRGQTSRVICDRADAALRMLDACVEIHPAKRGSVPVLAGTRFTIAQLVAELADGTRSANQIAEDFDLDAEMVKTFLEGLSIHIDRPMPR